jgi:hypothetical protein
MAALQRSRAAVREAEDLGSGGLAQQLQLFAERL